MAIVSNADVGGSIIVPTLKINDNRVVNIKKSNPNFTSKVNGDDSSWRYNIARIFDNYDSGGKMLDYSTTSNWIVDSSIKLLISDSLPKFGTSNDYKQPLSPFIEGLNKVTNVYNAMSALGGTNIVQSFMNGGKTFEDRWNSVINNLRGGSSDSSSKTTASFQPWVKNVQAWNGSNKGIQFDYTFKFAMGQYGFWNAKKEVVNPILNLITPALSQHIGAISQNGPYPNALNLITNMINEAFDAGTNGNNALDTQWKALKNSVSKMSVDENGLLNGVLNNAGGFFDSLGKLLETLVQSSYKDFVYDVSFGKIVTFKKMMIMDVKWNFSTTVDQYGWPVSGDVTLTFFGNIPLALTSSDEDINMAVRFGEGIQ